MRIGNVRLKTINPVLKTGPDDPDENTLAKPPPLPAPPPPPPPPPKFRLPIPLYASATPSSVPRIPPAIPISMLSARKRSIICLLVYPIAFKMPISFVLSFTAIIIVFVLLLAATTRLIAPILAISVVSPPVIEDRLLAIDPALIMFTLFTPLELYKLLIAVCTEATSDVESMITYMALKYGVFRRSSAALNETNTQLSMLVNNADPYSLRIPFTRNVKPVVLEPIFIETA